MLINNISPQEFVKFFFFYFSSVTQCFCVQWAEVLSADAFSAFEEAGLDDDQVSYSVFELTYAVATYVLC